MGVALARGRPLMAPFGQQPRPTIPRSSDCEQVLRLESLDFQCTVSQYGRRCHSERIGEFQDSCPESHQSRPQQLFLLLLVLAQLQVYELGRDWGNLERSGQSDHS